MIEWIAISVIGIAIFAELLLIVLWIANYKAHKSVLKEAPTVVILVAARDEEANLVECLDSLLELDYSPEKLQIWVGDDASTDGTWEIIARYSKEYSNINGMQITKSITKGNGKANVLAQLAHHCKSDWIFITDADIRVPKQWVNTMLAAAEKEEAVLVTGTSLVSGSAFFAKVQRLDWLYATAMLKVISDTGTPVTTMGNNMAILRRVYEEVGGFENLHFSVTEDLELFKQVVKKHHTLNLFSEGVLNKSTPQNSVLELLIQRKRWMRGAFELPLQLLGILLIQSFYMPAIILLIILNPMIGVSLWLIKWMLRFSFATISAKKLAEKVSIFDSFVTELFTMAFSLASVIYYLWPGKVYWKGRAY